MSAGDSGGELIYVYVTLEGSVEVDLSPMPPDEANLPLHSATCVDNVHMYVQSKTSVEINCSPFLNVHCQLILSVC